MQSVSPEEPETLSIGAVLSAIAAELDVARSLTLRVEESVCDLARRVPSETGLNEGLQQLDYVLQLISTVREFAAGAAAAAPAGDVAVREALASIGLQDVRNRISGATPALTDSNDAWEEF